MQGIARHEDAHAVLDSVGRARTELPPALHNIPRAFLDMLSNATPVNLDLNWAASLRSGDFNTEIPAYMTAYEPGKIPGITPDMAQRWTDAYSKTLPADAQSKIVRIGKISRSQVGK